MSIPFDVSRLLPAAQPVAHAVAQVCWKQTDPWFVGLLCFGSAAKGSIIPGASDIDFYLYLADAAFASTGTTSAGAVSAYPPGPGPDRPGSLPVHRCRRRAHRTARDGAGMGVSSR